MTSQSLRAFRTDLHGCFARRADALFELADALLAADPVASLPHLSLQAAHRRGWGSLYAALADGPARRRGPARAAGAAPGARRPAGLRRRPERLAALRRRGQPGARLLLPSLPPLRRPADRRRVGLPVAGPAQLRARQLDRPARRAARASDARTPTRSRSSRSRDSSAACPADGASPLFVFDAGYDSAQVTQGLEQLPVAVLVRLRADRCFYADPPPAVPSPKGGRPRKPRGQVRLQGSGDLAGADRRARASRTSSTARCGCAPGPGCTPSSRTTPAAAPARRGRSCAAPSSWSRSAACRRRPYPPQVLWLWWAGPGDAGPGPAVARLRPPLRPGAHAALLQAEPRLDDAARAAPGASRPLDLARGGRLHPAAPGTAVGRRPPPALGAAPGSGQADPVPRPAGPFRAAADGRDARPARQNRAVARRADPKGSRSGRATRYPALKKAA